MKITQEQIIKLASELPNNYALGSAIRELVAKANDANKIYADPCQISLFDLINKVTNNEDGNRY